MQITHSHFVVVLLVPRSNPLITFTSYQCVVIWFAYHHRCHQPSSYSCRHRAFIQSQHIKSSIRRFQTIHRKFDTFHTTDHVVLFLIICFAMTCAMFVRLGGFILSISGTIGLQTFFGIVVTSVVCWRNSSAEIDAMVRLQVEIRKRVHISHGTR